MPNSSPEIKIIIAAHKPYRMPEDAMYLPLFVGAEGKKDMAGNGPAPGMARDDTGDNISRLNPFFCELTGLYWAWKNLDADYVGLVQYRRHFGLRKDPDPWKRVLTYEDIRPCLGRIKIFVPKKRNYYIETLYSHYKHTHYAWQLDGAGAIIREKYPDYGSSYDRVMKRRYGYMFNMMILERRYLDGYCSWLFDILFELKKRTGTPELSPFEERFYGRVSEILFNVWLDFQLEKGAVKKDEIMEIRVISMEKVSRWKKAAAFLKARFLHAKYENSFREP